MKNLIQAAVVILFAASAAQAQQAVQWREQDGGNGHWYAIKTWNQKTSWEAAKLHAQSVGGHLATITSANEDTWTTQLTMGWTGAWFGLSGPYIGAAATAVCPDGNACFTWVTGEPFEYSRWHPGNPDNVTNAGAQGPVGVLLWEPNWTRAWQDSSQGDPAWYGDHRSAMIEWSEDCNNDGIVDFGQCRDGSLPDQNGNDVPDCCETGVPCGSGPPDGDSVGFLRLGRLTDTVALSASPAYGSESTHEFRIRFPTEDQPGNGRLWSEQNGMETDRAIGFGTFYAAQFSAHFGQCCQAPLHVVTVEELLDGQWHHVAMVRAPDEFRLYVDGMLRSVQPSFGQAGSCGGKCPRSFGAFRYSYTGDALTVESIIADLDWIAISSSSRYSGNSIIVPCESDVMADESTKMLFKFNEIGETTIVSEAGAIVGTLGTGFGGATEPRIVHHCQPVECAKADIVGDGFINGLDLGIMLGQWGPANPSGTCDINLDGVVDSLDLGVLLSFWGPCRN